MPADFGTIDSYKFFLNAGNIANLDKTYLKGANWLFTDQTKHNTYDSYWQARDLSRHMATLIPQSRLSPAPTLCRKCGELSQMNPR